MKTAKKSLATLLALIMSFQILLVPSSAKTFDQAEFQSDLTSELSSSVGSSKAELYAEVWAEELQEALACATDGDIEIARDHLMYALNDTGIIFNSFKTSQYYATVKKAGSKVKTSSLPELSSSTRYPRTFYNYTSNSEATKNRLEIRPSTLAYYDKDTMVGCFSIVNGYSKPVRFKKISYICIYDSDKNVIAEGYPGKLDTSIILEAWQSDATASSTSDSTENLWLRFKSGTFLKNCPPESKVTIHVKYSAEFVESVESAQEEEESDNALTNLINDFFDIIRKLLDVTHYNNQDLIQAIADTLIYLIQSSGALITDSLDLFQEIVDTVADLLIEWMTGE